MNPSAGKTTAKDNWSTVKNMVVFMIITTFVKIIIDIGQVRKKSQETAEQLNLNNVEKFKTANRQRTDILDLVSIIIWQISLQCLSYLSCDT